MDNKNRLGYSALREMCIKHNLFTCGDNEQYDKFFCADKMGMNHEEMITILWICSDRKQRDEIAEIYKAEYDKYFNKENLEEND